MVCTFFREPPDWLTGKTRKRVFARGGTSLDFEARFRFSALVIQRFDNAKNDALDQTISECGMFVLDQEGDSSGPCRGFTPWNCLGFGQELAKKRLDRIGAAFRFSLQRGRSEICLGISIEGISETFNNLRLRSCRLGFLGDQILLFWNW